MKLSAVAVDYDGTIARGDAVAPSVREAVAAARASGIVVLVVTGRILDDLRRAAGDLSFVDAVVAENGAVLHFPASQHTSILAPRLSDAFVAEASRRGIPIHPGQCLADAAAPDAPRLLGVIRSLELPLVLAFNGGRVMTLPQGVSKGTGLRTALETMRVSPRNTLALGDAENDHELLRLAEVGVAVGWGSPALRAQADIVLHGPGPDAVAAYIRELTGTGRLPVPPRARRHLVVGHTDDGREFSLAVRGRNVLVAGDAKSGKSWIAGLLSEQLILHGYSLCVIDPEGDYRALEGMPGVSVLGGAGDPPSPRELMHALRYPDRSIVIDLSQRPLDEKLGYIRSLLPTLNLLRRRTGLPHRILVDEAHYFLHDAGGEQLLDLERNGYTVVTYCASRLPAELLAATEVMIITRESNAAEIDAIRRTCARCQNAESFSWSMLSQLRIGEAVALPVTEEAGGELRRFRIGARLTPHVRHREKYVDVPVGEHHAFVFSADGHANVQRARTLRQFVLHLEGAPLDELEPYIRRGDFSRWIGQVFGDAALATELRVLEEQHRRAARADTLAEMVASIRNRYDLLDTASRNGGTPESSA